MGTCFLVAIRGPVNCAIPWIAAYISFVVDNEPCKTWEPVCREVHMVVASAITHTCVVMMISQSIITLASVCSINGELQDISPTLCWQGGEKSMYTHVE